MPSRIEAGFPLFGTDITDDNLPQEIGRNQQAISFTKGCYLGQETVARIDALGHVNRLLARVKFTAGEVPATGTELFAADKPVGKVTSACWSPEFGGPLAFALLRRTQTAAGTQLTSASGPAEVCQPASRRKVAATSRVFSTRTVGSSDITVTTGTPSGPGLHRR